MGTLQEQNWLSVVIPTLNEAAALGVTLAVLAGAPILHEVVIADGGSSDDTVALARAAGALVVTALRGRGLQLAAGAAAASGRWLLFLHADCRPEIGWGDAVGAFAARPQAVWRAGYFDFALDDPAAPARRLERLVAWRCRLLALPYGDQGLLIARGLYDAIGGFAPLPLMEDVDLARRLGRRRLARIGLRAVSSARRYRRDGYWRRVLRNLACIALYFGGVPAGHISRLYG
jgi:rSAM/selenodomain-associated transferase 2